MKKLVFVTILFCCVSFIAFGCSNDNNKNAVMDNNLNVENNSEQFEQLMDDVFNGLQPGTAGSSLKAVNAVVKLLDYSFDHKIDDNSIKAWIIKIDISDPMNQEKIESLLSVMSSVGEDNFSELMSEAGANSSKYPWDSETIENVNNALNIINENLK